MSVIGGSVYMWLAWILKIPDLMAFARVLRKLGNWRSVLVQSEEAIEAPPTQGEDLKPM